MFRLGLVLLLAIEMAVQGLMLPHAHAAPSMNEPDGHASRPHFHTSHDHHHHSHKHSHHQHGHPHPCSNEKSTSTASDESPASHDDSAVYIDDQLPLPVRRLLEISPPIWSILLTEWQVIPSTTFSANSILLDQPPDPEGLCPLYLRLLALRV